MHEHILFKYLSKHYVCACVLTNPYVNSVIRFLDHLSRRIKLLKEEQFDSVMPAPEVINFFHCAQFNGA